MAKKRLDVAMVEQGLAESRQKAQAIIMAGQVYVNGQKVDKAGAPVTEDAAIEVRGKTLRYVSRGGLKLEKAMQLWPITLNGFVCADIGASTGGFTDCMLQNGAEKVHAANAGFGVKDITFSPIKGPEGNIEYLGYLTTREVPPYTGDLAALVEQSHSAWKEAEG